MKRVAQLKSGYVLNYETDSFSVDSRILSLSLENCENSRKFENDVQHENLLNFDEVVFDYENAEYSAKLAAWAGLNMYPDAFWRTNVQFVVKNVKLNGCGVSVGNKLLFYVPYVKFMQMVWSSKPCGGSCEDYTKLFFCNKTCILRNSYGNRIMGRQGVPIYLSSCNEEKNNGVYIEIEVEAGDSLISLSEIVNRMACMLSLCFGKKLMWESVWSLENGRMQLLQLSDNFLSDSQPEWPIVIYTRDGKMALGCNPISFLKKVEKNYSFDYEWWRVSVLWYLNGKTSHALEVAKLIEGMLLDRLTQKIFSVIVEESLNVDLAIFKNVKGKMQNPKTGIRNPLEIRIAKGRAMRGLTREETAFLDMCSAWISQPEYIVKITSVFEFAGLLLGNTEQEELKERNTLAHNGEIGAIVGENAIMQYDSKITKYCLLLFFSMLGYNDWFHVPLYNVKVVDEMPFCDRLQINNIRRLSQKLLKN